MGHTKNKISSIPGLNEKDISIIINELKMFPEIETALLFGSRAKGIYQKGSDIDIALTGTAVTCQTCTELHFQLNEESPLPWYFDVVQLESVVNEDLKSHILRVGIEIYRRERRTKSQI